MNWVNEKRVSPAQLKEIKFPKDLPERSQFFKKILSHPRLPKELPHEISTPDQTSKFLVLHRRLN